jgi:hypothetical protein
MTADLAWLISPIGFLAVVVSGGICLLVLGLALAILAAFVLFCRNGWCRFRDAWREIGEP